MITTTPRMMTFHSKQIIVYAFAYAFVSAFAML